MNKTLIDIGIQIRNFRTEAKLSQKELAKKSLIDRAQLSKIEQGIIEGVQFVTIYKIFESLGFKMNFEKDSFLKFAVKPFVKWVGGKTQLLKQILENMPNTFNNYFEPFVGGGALLFKLQPKKFYINDLNFELINAYKCFTNKKSFEQLQKILEKHEKLHSEEYFLKVRNLDRQSNFKKYSYEQIAGRLIYINKSCFNGLYRVNSKGLFNVPSGKKKRVNAFDRNVFKNIFDYFRTTEHHITNIDFAKAVEDAKKGDFVYFDPPYDTLNNQTFTTYNKGGFGKEEQVRLSNVYKDLAKRGVKVMLSNHDTTFIRGLYKGFKIINVSGKRMINSVGTKRGAVPEVLIINY